MNTRSFELNRPKAILRGTAWDAKKPGAVVLLEHGLADHYGRYGEMALFLAQHGTSVYGYDKRGHGLTAGPLGSAEHEQNAGWVASAGGWDILIQDALAMMDFVRMDVKNRLPAKAPMPPLFYFGHSMGSFLARAVVADSRFSRDSLAGIILSGSAASPGLAGRIGAVLASLLSALKGFKTPSPLIESLMTGAYATMACKPEKPRTRLDWINSQPEKVDEYRSDPWCGRILAASFYRDIVRGLLSVSSRRHRRNFPKNLPVLLYSGDHDPVGGMGRGVCAVYAGYKKCGVEDVQLQLFVGGRHEMHHERENQEVFQSVRDWIETRKM